MHDNDTPGIVEDCQQALQDLAHEDILALADAYPEERRLYLDWYDLDEWDDKRREDAASHRRLATTWLGQPEQMQEYFEEALRTYPAIDGPGMGQAHVMVRNLPGEATFAVGEFSPSERLGRLTEFEGQITKRTEVDPRLEEGAFECLRCGTLTYLPQPDYGKMREPKECQGCERQGFFRLNDDQSRWEDYQKIRLQQPPEDAHGEGEYIDIHLHDDLTGDDATESGQRTTFVGQLESVYTGKVVHDKTVVARGFTPEESTYEDLALDEYRDTIDLLADRDDRFEILVGSLAPDHEGNWVEKAAVVLQLFGGWRRESLNGGYYRGDSHIYLLGDPGVGKTNLLRAAAEVAPRAVKTDGTGSSSAGLTAAITKDSFSDQQWTIEAGTLVLANEGIACVDELDKGESDDLDALHTALETQEVHVNKAGKNATLPARTPLLGAGNPTGGHFDPSKEIADQVALKSPLLSRFDLILTMRTKEDEERIRRVAQQMVDGRQTAGKLVKGEEVDPDALANVEAELDPDEFAAYIAAGKQYRPVVRDPEVGQAMVEWFTDLKTSLPQRYQAAMGSADDYEGPPLPITARKLDAMQRFAEASARVRLSETVEMQDVERVKPFIERSLADIGIAPKDNSAIGSVSSDVDIGDVGV